MALLLLIWAVLVGWSRIALKLHFLVDVLVGWVVGAITAVVVMIISPWLIGFYDRLMVLITS